MGVYKYLYGLQLTAELAAAEHGPAARIDGPPAPTDGGVTWKRLSGNGLPAKPVARIGLAIAASDANVVYAVMGSNEGVVWRSDDQGEHWTLVGKDQEADARPFYFSHLEVDPNDPNHVFAISNDLLETTDGGHTFYGQNPAYGASFTYYLSKAVKEPGELVITDSAGKVVRTMKGLHAGTTEQGPVGPAQETEGKKVPWVPGQAGLNRIHWDLRADGPVRWRSALPFLQGPASGAMLPPGSYTATLKIGGHTASQSFTVVNDPASHASQQDMQATYQTAEAALHELSQLDVALNRLHAIDEQLKALQVAVKGSPDEHAVKSAADSLTKASETLEAKITSNPGADESELRVPDQIHEEVARLGYMLQGEDEAPTAAILQQKALLDPKYRAAIQAYDDFLTSDVASFNQAMTARHLTGVVAGATLTP